MHSNSKKIKRWRIKTKKRMIQELGGRCCICGYDKCRDSLTFHHLDPKTKKFGFGKLMTQIRSWEIIARELEKCVLVCQNCHSELNAGLAKVPKSPPRYKFKKDSGRYKNVSDVMPRCIPAY